ncbi:hypothetical protein ACFYWN_08590 [Streptomyces sp. NPDC002917]|uniref:hypothetical protein n=1 Tax=Streptomyces sp. NPDC002917 TaxID=3364671 RepID=UPI0036B34B95
MGPGWIAPARAHCGTLNSVILYRVAAPKEIVQVSRRSCRTAASLIVLPLLLVGCTSAGGEHPKINSKTVREGAQTPPPVSAIPTIDSANDKPLPLDPYLVNPRQLSVINKAYAKSISLCMARFGFTYRPTVESPGPRDSDAPVTRIDGRFGHQSARLMAKWGYHPEGGVLASQSSPEESTRKISPDMVVAGRGSSDPGKAFGPGGQIINGKTVPYHGCMGEAVKELTGSADGALYDPQIAIDVKLKTLNESQQDDRTKTAFAKWSQCMKIGGFAYKDPLAAGGDPQWRKASKPTAHELKVATADAACRHKNNVVGIWYAVDFSYQEKAIAANATTMARVKTDLESKMKAAMRVLAK